MLKNWTEHVIKLRHLIAHWSILQLHKWRWAPIINISLHTLLQKQSISRRHSFRCLLVSSVYENKTDQCERCVKRTTICWHSLDISHVNWKTLNIFTTSWSKYLPWHFSKRQPGQDNQITCTVLIFLSSESKITLDFSWIYFTNFFCLIAKESNCRTRLPKPMISSVE